MSLASMEYSLPLFVMVKSAELHQSFDPFGSSHERNKAVEPMNRYTFTPDEEAEFDMLMAQARADA
jgi:hypothetical protein